MAKQDDWKRITLRIPPELYDRIAESAGASSVNAAIIHRLNQSFHLSAPTKEISEYLDQIIKDLHKLKQYAEK